MSAFAAAFSAAALAGAAGQTSAAVAATKVIAMTTLQKTVIGAAFAAAVGTGIYEAHQVSVSRAEVARLMQQQAPLEEQIRQLQRERDDAANRLAMLAGENRNLKSNATELLKLRAQVARLAPTSAPTGPTTDPIEATAQDWLKQVNLIKAKFDEWPARKIPEIQFLADYDWLQSARGGQLEHASEITWRHMLARLRLTAKTHFAHRMGDALQNFIADHEGQLPTQLSELDAYYRSSAGEPAQIDRSIWDRYQLVQSGNLSNFVYTEPLIVEKNPPVDPDYDSRFRLTAYGYLYDGVGRSTDLGPGQGPFNYSDKMRKYRKE